MEILRSIAFYTEARGMPFIVIGGQAINYYGVSRQTGDIDLVVRRSQKDQWLELMARLNYIKGQDDDRFTRFRPDSIAAWPIDLMFVDDETFEKLCATTALAEFGSASGVRVASVKHLVTLKLHALKHYQKHRFAKDYQDVLELLNNHKTCLSMEDLKELCIRYVNVELFNRIISDLGEL